MCTRDLYFIGLETDDTLEAAEDTPQTLQVSRTVKKELQNSVCNSAKLVRTYDIIDKLLTPHLLTSLQAGTEWHDNLLFVISDNGFSLALIWYIWVRTLQSSQHALKSMWSQSTGKVGVIIPFVIFPQGPQTDVTELVVEFLGAFLREPKRCIH